jgi:hypothetical protein
MEMFVFLLTRRTALVVCVTIFSGGAYLLFFNIGINATGFMNDMEEYFSGK